MKITFIASALIASLGVYIEPGYIEFHWPQAIRVTFSLWLFCMAVRSALRVQNPAKAMLAVWGCFLGSIACIGWAAVMREPFGVAFRCGVGALVIFLVARAVRGGVAKLPAIRLPRLSAFAKPAVVAAGVSLDQVLFNYTKEDAYTRRDLHASVAIIGASGSGKSSGSGRLFQRAILKLKGSGGLILASKPEDLADWTARAREAGRLDDLVVIDDSMRERINCLDLIRQAGGDAKEITHFIMTTSESLEGGGGGDSEPFWKMSQQRLIHDAVVALMLGEGEVTTSKLLEFIASAAQSPTVFSDKELYAKWAATSFNNRVMEAADAKQKSVIDKHDFQSVVAYWTKEFPALDARVKSSILAGVINTLHTFNTGVVRELLSTETTVSPRDMEKGKFIFVNMPIDRFAQSGRIVMASLKFITQKHVLRRQASPGDATIVIFADEAQQIVSSLDGDYLAKCRSHHGCMIYLTQSLHSYFGEAHGHAGEHKAKALLTNFKTKIFHTLGDHDTAAYASSLLGKRREGFVSYPTGGEREGGGNLSEQYEDVLKPIDLLTGLRTSGGVVDGWVIRSGEPFASGTNHLLIWV